MNPSIPLHGLLKINDSEISLGLAKPQELLMRASQAMAAHKGEASTLTLRLSKTPIPSLGAAPEDAAMSEFESNLISAPPASEVELFPGVTVEAAYEAEQSPEGQAYKRICNPEKRVGLSQLLIDEIIANYRSRFPEIWHLFPVWQD